MSKVNEETLCEQKINKYKNKISKNWNESRQSIIDVGTTLYEAKVNSEKNKGFNNKSWKILVNDELPFTVRTANRLIAIANCEWITSGKYNNKLPVSWGTLYEISTLTKEQFEEGIKTEKITWNTTRKNIEEFKDSFNSSQGSNSTKSVGKKHNHLTLGNLVIDKDKVLDVKKLQALIKTIEDAISKSGLDVELVETDIKYINKVEKKGGLKKVV
jgi:hypothetical protein